MKSPDKEIPFLWVFVALVPFEPNALRALRALYALYGLRDNLFLPSPLMLNYE
jgi:hypothetical protein